ncbi:MAG: hypothetical protein ACYC9J_13140, partial [Sulfuricaulis sp.]
MNLPEQTWSSHTVRPTGMYCHNVVSLASDVLPLFDLISLLLAAYFSALLYTHWLVPFSFTPRFGSNFG